MERSMAIACKYEKSVIGRVNGFFRPSASRCGLPTRKGKLFWKSLRYMPMHCKAREPAHPPVASKRGNDQRTSDDFSWPGCVESEKACRPETSPVNHAIPRRVALVGSQPQRKRKMNRSKAPDRTIRSPSHPSIHRKRGT